MLIAVFCAIVALYLLLVDVDLAGKVEELAGKVVLWWNSFLTFINPSEHAFGKFIVLLTFCLIFCCASFFLSRRP
jgi:hypothetical protein